MYSPVGVSGVYTRRCVGQAYMISLESVRSENHALLGKSSPRGSVASDVGGAEKKRSCNSTQGDANVLLVGC